MKKIRFNGFTPLKKGELHSFLPMGFNTGGYFVYRLLDDTYEWSYYRKHDDPLVRDTNTNIYPLINSEKDRFLVCKEVTGSVVNLSVIIVLDRKQLEEMDTRKNVELAESALNSCRNML